MIRIVADDKIPFLKGALDDVAEVTYLPGSKITREDLIQADALIVRTRTKCNANLLEGTGIQFIATATIGFDHIDADYCQKKGIQWTNAPGCNSGSVRQYVSSALAFIVQQTGKQFNEITLGIVGAGNVGSKVEKMAAILGIRTLVNDPPRQRKEGNSGFTDLQTLICEADIVTFHVPLQKDGPDRTFQMADSQLLNKMKPGAWLINSSRGEVVETHALISALENKHISGAILDVWEDEPDISRDLLKLATLATPHIAGYSADGKANGTAMSVQALSKFFSLGKDDWYPANVPVAPNSPITIDGKGKSMEQIFAELSLKAYNIESDSEILKQSPQTFEKQRGDYPIRREPEAISVNASNMEENHREIIEMLGYRLL